MIVFYGTRDVLHTKTVRFNALHIRFGIVCSKPRLGGKLMPAAVRVLTTAHGILPKKFKVCWIELNNSLSLNGKTIRRVLIDKLGKSLNRQAYRLVL